MNLKKLERYLRVNLFGTGPSSYKKIIYRAAVLQKLRNTGIKDAKSYIFLFVNASELTGEFCLHPLHLLQRVAFLGVRYEADL